MQMTRARRFLSQAAWHQAAAAARSILFATVAIAAGIYGVLVALAAGAYYEAAGAVFGITTGLVAAAALLLGGSKRIDRALAVARRARALASSLIAGAAVLRIRIFDALAVAVNIFARVAARAAGAALALISDLARALHARARAHARIVVLARTTTRSLALAGAC